MEKYEHAKFLIERFDHYYDNINSKGAFYIGLNTFLLSGVVIGYTSFFGKINFSLLIWILIFLQIMFCLASIAFTIFAIKPYSKDNHANDESPSLLYFGGIAKHECTHFKQKFIAQEKEELLVDMLQQVHSLARGLKIKFTRLKLASLFILLQFTVMIPLFILFIQNYK
jgi:hypothetical protein